MRDLGTGSVATTGRWLRRTVALAFLALLLLVFAGTVAGQSPSSPGSDTADASVAGAGAAGELTAYPLSPDAGTAPGSYLLLAPAPTPIVHPDDGSSNTCYDCHVKTSPEQQQISETWQASIHGQGGVTCADCHGGDPTSDEITIAMGEQANFIGVPGREQSVGICGSCHSDPDIMGPYGLPTDQYEAYYTSVHGERLASAKDDKVAICIDCHGSHDVKKASDPTAPVYSFNIPQLCSSCHSDVSLMEPYGIPTDQYDVYAASIHGQKLLEEKDIRAPNCASCHGSHGAKPPTSAEVVDVCGKCHTATQELYLQSKHSRLEEAAPKCWTCHGTHDVALSGEYLFFHETPPDYTCTTCHDPVDQSLTLDRTHFENPEDRRCDTCHHPESLIHAQIEGIHGALTGAVDANDAAGASIDEAASLGMLVNDAEVKLTEAKTALIQGRAAVHTTKLTEVTVHTDESVVKANEAQAIADAQIQESILRRQVMVIVVIIIAINVVALYALKRILDRRHATQVS
jgi:hypothetical protein